MHRTLSYFIIFTFLFAAYSASGQETGKTDPLEQALRWERAVYESEGSCPVNDVLLSKARCYSDAGLYGEALSTLDRIRLYLLSPAEASEVLYSKALCCMETGDSGAALSYLEESGQASAHPGLYSLLLAGSWRFSESEEWALKCSEDSGYREAVHKLFRKVPGPKKETPAMMLSMIPPAGQLYLGETGRGILSMLLNTGAAAFTALELVDGNWITGILGGGLLLNETYFKANLERNVSRVGEVNKENADGFCRSLAALLDSFQIER